MFAIRATAAEVHACAASTWQSGKDSSTPCSDPPAAQDHDAARLAGLEQAAGEISIAGTPVHSRRRIMVPPHQRDIGMVFQSYAIWPHMGVRERGVSRADAGPLLPREIKQKVGEALQPCSLRA